MKAGRLPPASRGAVVLPPPGWRKAMPMAVKLQVIINQHGRAPDGSLLDAIGEGIEFDHRPCLADRPYDESRDETIPPANDPAFIVALPAAAHHQQTGADLKRMGKEARLAERQAAFREMLERKVAGQKRLAKGAMQSRPFRRKGESYAEALARVAKPARERIHVSMRSYGTNSLFGTKFARMEILLDGVKYRCDERELDLLYQGQCPEDLDLERIEDEDDDDCHGSID